MQGGEVSCKLQAASCKLQAARAWEAWEGVSRSSWGFAGFIDCLLRGDNQCFFEHKNKIPVCVSRQGFRNLILTMTYSHMGKPHTTIGDASFHY
jgi:hypothetical protein